MFKHLNPFRTTPAHEIALLELADAERRLLDAQSSREYAAAMVAYHEQRITRLRRVLANSNPAQL